MGKLNGVAIILAFSVCGGLLVHVIANYVNLYLGVMGIVPVCLGLGLYSGYLAALVDKK